MTVDEILSAGRYTDRRGRLWEPSDMLNEWFGGIPGDPLDRAWWCSPREMRLLIERDMHRDECDWLEQCCNHPVPHVLGSVSQGFYVYEVRADWADQSFDTHAEAMDAAYKLAVANE